MFGPGFVWLVWMRDSSSATARRGDWRILSTYLAGTPYPEAGHRQQGIDMNNNNSSSYASYHDSQHVTNYAGSFGAHSRQGQQDAMIPPGGAQLMPVLCVNTWEHVYIFDYGLQGKIRPPLHPGARARPAQNPMRPHSGTAERAAESMDAPARRYCARDPRPEIQDFGRISSIACCFFASSLLFPRHSVQNLHNYFGDPRPSGLCPRSTTIGRC